MLSWQCFCQGVLGWNCQVFMKNGLCFTPNVFLLDFYIQIRNQCMKIGPCSKFQPDWTKGKGARISTWKLLDDLILTLWWWCQQNFYGFGEIVYQSTIMPSVAVIGPQIKENRGGTLCPQLIFYQNTPAWIVLKVRGWCSSFEMSQTKVEQRNEEVKALLKIIFNWASSEM